ncbi:Leukotriene A-4 hydrolase-like protein [Zea mays]|uniref:Leukotriene A-4 hydrolase-like protein n=1 Tax=Zea mays TaxID=4577 RepID=A0A1D6N514_MAIZE|nr:Leukotriene A-4 hydrolase-like protein [Zea mays]
MHPVVSCTALTFYLDFAASTIHASAVLTLSAPHSGDLLLDTCALAVHSASTHADPPEPILFSLGTALTLALPHDTASFRLTFSTSPAASALQWLARHRPPPRSPLSSRSAIPSTLAPSSPATTPTPRASPSRS